MPTPKPQTNTVLNIEECLTPEQPDIFKGGGGGDQNIIPN